MSGIAGIFHRDGCLVRPESLSRMMRAIAHRGLDGSGHWISGSIGLGQQQLHTTPEAHREKLPLGDEISQLSLVLDGRIDNREELKMALQRTGAFLRDETDAELILQAYKCWGENCAPKIIGDFAFAIWDGRQKQLYAARDAFGIRPFYYFLNDRIFLFGSEIQQLFQFSTVPCEPHEAMIGEFLSDRICNKAETLYRNIFRLPPAHRLIIDAEKLRQERYWIPQETEIRYAQDRDYLDHFLAIFSHTLQSAMRSDRPVGFHLSGGLDSSSVVALAHLLRQRGIVSVDKADIFSLIFPELECDESRFIHEFLQVYNLEANLISGKNQSPAFAQIASRSRYFPSPPNGRMMDPIRNLARLKNRRVLLTGIGGDEWLSGSSFHAADLLRRGQLIKFFQAIRKENLSYFRAFRQFALIPISRSLLPESAFQFFRKISSENFELLPSAFSNRIHLAERLHKNRSGKIFASEARQELYEMATGGWQTFRFELENRDDAEFGVEMRHPLNDRRFAEFALSLPEEQRNREGKEKYILREAMRELLPPSIRQRTTKADFSEVFPQAFQAVEGEKIFADLAIASMGWIDGIKAQKIYRRMMKLYFSGNRDYAEFTWVLWMVFGIEIWFRTVFLKENFSPEKFQLYPIEPQPA